MKASAIPAVGDCGSFFCSSLGLGGGCRLASGSFLSDGLSLNVEKVCVNLDRSFKNRNISSEFLIWFISGFTLSAKSEFCER